MEKGKQPISPFMLGSYYKFQLTSVLSFIHRVTGVLLSFGTLFLAYWLISIASGREAYEQVLGILNTNFGQLLLYCWAWALYYHLLNGIRHLFWDAGLGFELRTIYISGWVVVVGSIALTVISWIATGALT